MDYQQFSEDASNGFDYFLTRLFDVIGWAFFLLLLPFTAPFAALGRHRRRQQEERMEQYLAQQRIKNP